MFKPTARRILSASRTKRITFLLILASIVGSQFTVGATREHPQNDRSSTQHSGALDRFEFAELHMGVRTRLVVWAPSLAKAESACGLAFRRIAQLENIMSDYRRDSELMRLSSRAHGLPVKVSDDLFFVLARAQEVSRISDGAFDVTAGPMIQLWRRIRATKTLPTAQELAQARAVVGWQKLKLNRANQTAQLLVPGMQLDLGGIAKGYAGDCALDVLRRQGITRALFEAGGDIVLGDAPPGDALPGQRGWNIEVENAAPGAPRLLRLANCAVSTSGDVYQFVAIGGRRYSHIVNPRSGLGLTTRKAVTVIAPHGITSDSLSTALSVADAKTRRRLLRAFPDVRAFVRQVP